MSKIVLLFLACVLSGGAFSHAYDASSSSGYLLWGGKNIYRTAQNDANSTTTLVDFSSVNTYIMMLNVDVQQGYMYWTGNGIVYRAHLNGLAAGYPSNVTSAADDNDDGSGSPNYVFYKDMPVGYSLGFDFASQQMFFESGAWNVYSMDLVTRKVTLLTQAQYPGSASTGPIAVHGNQLYWAAEGSGLFSMPSDGSSSPRSLGNVVSFPRGLIATSSALWVSGFINNIAYEISFGGSVIASYGPGTPVTAMGEMCSVAYDEVSGTLYGGVQSQPYASNAGVWRMDPKAGGDKLLFPWIPLQQSSDTLGMCAMAVVPNVVPAIKAVSTTKVSRLGNTELLIQADNVISNTQKPTCLFGGIIAVGAQFVLPGTIKCVAPVSPVAGQTTLQIANFDYGSDYSAAVNILYQ
eukprot:ANDGO_01486.mRNA.1 hypothetical protein